jgi:hypothetical protein
MLGSIDWIGLDAKLSNLRDLKNVIGAGQNVMVNQGSTALHWNFTFHLQ